MIYWDTVTNKDQIKKFSSLYQWKAQNLLAVLLCDVLSQAICLGNTYLVQLVISA